MKVAVIGAGTMGSGIAQAFAVHGNYQVILCDIKIEFAENGKQIIQKNLAKLVSRERMTQADMDATLARVTPGLNDAAADADLVVESALEVMTIKKQLFKDLQAICKPETMFATNTSSLSVTELSAGLDRPVVGMHFFNPAPVMKLVEVISGLNTPPELAEKVTEIARDLGKEPVQVKDSAGFVVNRVLVPMINEAIGVLADGVASAEDIDTAMKLGANHPMGPLALGDLIGLDVCLAIMDVLYTDTLDSKYRASPLLRQMVRAGQLGRKTGKGFFSY
ncbi:MAG: 3-hydroxyacyl-CoA dehydrogenase NAD-binding domain-containing protein [Oscillospiraceae bacterium]|nr:3-hydroxyacyl-CoA dehydrogenase NAD-binding domain-containing protein [Oscillospiraceae bacterium]